MSVYLLHFSAPYHHARHYLGYSADPAARFETHTRGAGSPLVRAAVQAGLGVVLARLWPDGDRTFERELKNQKNTPRLCPICQNETQAGPIRKAS